MDRQNIGYQDEEDFGEHFQLQVEITITKQKHIFPQLIIYSRLKKVKMYS